MHKVTAYRREMIASRARYTKVDVFEVNHVEHAYREYQESYLSDEKNGTEVIFIENGTILATYRVAHPVPFPEFLPVELVR